MNYVIGVALFVLGFVISVPFGLVPGVVGGLISGTGLAFIIWPLLTREY